MFGTQLNSFKDSRNRFGILLKGKSLKEIHRVHEEYDDCFIVNNFDKEIEVVGRYLMNKRTVHLVNRLMTAPLHKKNYKALGIKEIQLTRPTLLWDRALIRAVPYYWLLGLKTVFLPQELMAYSKKYFKDEGIFKFPNTGILAIVYALSVLRPKNLWIVGLDLYQSDYLVRRPHQDSLKTQQAYMDKIKAIEVFNQLVATHPDVNFHVVTYFDGFDKKPNLSII